ncbi:hypothetical protein HPA15_08925 [Streptococcus suis]|nr:hypothetical protein [Streptococcus suis]
MVTERQKNLEKLKELIYQIFNLEDIECNVVIDSTDLVNARIEHYRGEYTVTIYSGLINNIQYLIHDKLRRFDNNDRRWFQNFQYLDFLKIFEHVIPESDDEKILYDIKNLFASSIFLIVIFHELGHVVANHIGKNTVYSEFSSNEIGNLESQEKEMVADWLSIKKFFSLILSNLEQGEIQKTDNIENIEKYLNLLQRAMVFTWLVLALEFHFYTEPHLASIDELISKKHPPNAVRFYYCTEAMTEAAIDSINKKFSLSDEESELICSDIFYDSKIYFQSFLQLMSLPFNDLYTNPLIYEYYILLRNVPYRDGNQDDSFHLQKLTQEQFEGLNELIVLFNQGFKID